MSDLFCCGLHAAAAFLILETARQCLVGILGIESNPLLDRLIPPPEDVPDGDDPVHVGVDDVIVHDVKSPDGV